MQTASTENQTQINATFLVDLDSLKYRKSWENVKADMNRVYNKNLRCGTWTVEVDDDKVKLL